MPTLPAYVFLACQTLQSRWEPVCAASAASKARREEWLRFTSGGSLHTQCPGSLRRALHAARCSAAHPNATCHLSAQRPEQCCLGPFSLKQTPPEPEISAKRPHVPLSRESRSALRHRAVMGVLGTTATTVTAQPSTWFSQQQSRLRCFLQCSEAGDWPYRQVCNSAEKTGTVSCHTARLCPYAAHARSHL